MNLKYDHKYDEIINLEHHKSKKHPPMSLYARSAQFAPFAALTGYEEAVTETAKDVSDRIEIEEEFKNILDSKIHLLMEIKNKKPEVTFTYFIPDLTKDGGKYITKVGVIKKVDLYNQKIILEDKTELVIGDIIDIKSNIVNL